MQFPGKTSVHQPQLPLKEKQAEVKTGLNPNRRIRWFTNPARLQLGPLAPPLVSSRHNHHVDYSAVCVISSNKNQHTNLTLEKKILPPLLPGFELATFRSRVRRSNQQTIPA